MTFKEKLEIEKDNHSKIILFNDKGLFYNLIERSAYSFYTRLKPFKVHVKTIKGIEIPIVYLGVPVGKREEYLKGLTTTTDEQGNITALLNEPIDENDYQVWKKNIIDKYLAQKTSEVQQLNSEKSNVDTIQENILIHQCIQEIKSLNIASMTPMDAMLYLNSLQQKVKDIKL